MSYMESNILWDIFDEVEIAFIAVCHMYCNVYQALSSTSVPLRRYDVLTLQGLHNVHRE